MPIQPASNMHCISYSLKTKDLANAFYRIIHHLIFKPHLIYKLTKFTLEIQRLAFLLRFSGAAFFKKQWKPRNGSSHKSLYRHYLFLTFYGILVLWNNSITSQECDRICAPIPLPSIQRWFLPGNSYWQSSEI